MVLRIVRTAGQFPVEVCLFVLVHAAISTAVFGCSPEPDDHAYPPPTDSGIMDSGAGGDSDAQGSCSPKTCVQLGAECGSVLDGCGATIDCGQCAGGLNCGGDGPNKCGTSACTPKTCTQLNASCGLVSDGCGEVLSCGTCSPPLTCGGGGDDNQCGCTPATCSSIGAECGVVHDGCGDLLDCGACPSNKICGGDQDNRCSDKPCVPDTCQSLGAACGSHPDGCAGVINCGSCTAPQTCGGGGNPYLCGCTPTSCSAEGAECGSLADGCGGTLQCGTCTSPKQCGASGVPNVCGCNSTICPPFYVNDFEDGTDFPGAWTAWHNCAEDGDWFVKQAFYPAPSGGTNNLRFHTTTFDSSCNWPGAYAQSPPLSVQPGRTYRVESWSRHSDSAAGASIVFFDANDQTLSMAEDLWPSDNWQYQANPPTTAVAPAGASYLQVRIRLVTPEAYLDFDRLEVYLEY